jgi:hypothetical protein
VTPDGATEEDETMSGKGSHLRKTSDRIFRVVTRNAAGDTVIHVILTFAEDLGGDELHVGWRLVRVAGEPENMTYGDWYLPKAGGSLDQVWARRRWGPIAIEDTGRRLAEVPLDEQRLPARLHPEFFASEPERLAAK